jgi:L-fuculose-phosphate aldolase
MMSDETERAAVGRLRALVAVAVRSLSIGGHDDFDQGQVSARLPHSDTMLIKDAGTGPART